MPGHHFYFGQINVSNKLITFHLLCGSSFSGTPQISKSFKLPTFWLLDSASGLCGLLKWKDPFFIGKRIVTLSPTIPIKAALLSTSRPIASRSYLLIFPPTFNLFQILAAALPILCFMDEGPSHDPIVTNPPTDEDIRNDSRAESVAAMTSSLTHGAALMAKGEIPELSDFFKKTSVTDGERQAYHERGWLTSNVISYVPEVDIQTVEGSTTICFESHLIAGLGLPPSKFLVTIMGYLNCELFHFNPNAISVLSTFVMLCECWLGIALDTSLFWYYYSPARYSKVVYGEIGLSLCCHRRDEYILASFKSCWKGSQERWILVDMHKPVPWGNMLLFPPIIKDKWNKPPMNDRLTALVKHVAKLREAELKACHCVKEFHLR
jgi:hypothetical protein